MPRVRGVSEEITWQSSIYTWHDCFGQLGLMRRDFPRRRCVVRVPLMPPSYSARVDKGIGVKSDRLRCN